VKDLSGRSGLPLWLREDGSLEFGADLPAVEPAVRTLTEMREVLADPGATGPEQLYYMYRDVGRPADKARTAAAGLRYDITVVVPALLGKEHAKTYGHYHPLAPDGAYYPEVYEVISGRAIYVLQRRGADGAVDDVLVIPAREGDKVFMLPGYGHVTVNPGNEPLVMANWVAAAFASEYGDYRSRHGAACYEEVVDGAQRWVANPHYGAVPAARTVRPLCPEEATGLRAGRPMYPDGVAHPERLAYLVAPKTFPGAWAELVG
jgi:glucose-6-phosphate isomerase